MARASILVVLIATNCAINVTMTIGKVLWSSALAAAARIPIQARSVQLQHAVYTVSLVFKVPMARGGALARAVSG